jgi:hypothetical protein
MPSLRGTKVYRSGVTASRWNLETERISATKRGADKPTLNVEFQMASKGGGITEVSLRIGPAAFDTILNEMWKVDPEEMVKLMVRQMHGHFWPK